MKYCETCKNRDKDGRCQSEKLEEDWGRPAEERDDMLIYDYGEGGGFWVGPKFGCVHHIVEIEMTDEYKAGLDAAIKTERDACAAVCDMLQAGNNFHGTNNVPSDCAAAIRERSYLKLACIKY